MADINETTGIQQWVAANRRYLESELHRLRLVLQRRVLWLRQQWQSDTLKAPQGLVISDARADALLAPEDSNAEVTFQLKDPKAKAVTRSIAEVDREINRQVESLANIGQAPSLEVLVRLFGLSKFERNVLLLCLAPELDPAFERLYGYVQDDLTRKYPTFHLAMTLFAGHGEAWSQARGSLMSNGTLRRLRLVKLQPEPFAGAAAAACPLRIDERIGNYLLGVNRLDENVADLLRPLPPALLTASQQDLVQRLQQWLDGIGRQGPWPAFNLVGPPGAGKGALARALCERVRLQLYQLDAARLPGSALERQEMLRLLEREALLSQFAVYLDVAKTDESVLPSAVSPFEDVIEQLDVFLLVGSRERWQTRRRLIAVQLPKADTAAQRELWQQALAGVEHSLDGKLEALVQQFCFGPETIRHAIAAAQDFAAMNSSKKNVELSREDLWRACRQQTGWRLDELAQPIVPCHGWEDIVLPEDVYRQLQEIAAQAGCRHQVYEVWEFGRKLNRGRGISALFAGPSGTGKTLAAEILANHLDLSLYRIDLSGVVSKYIGETEKNLRKVFDAAEQSGAILFFDEADALFGKRSEVKDSHDRYANIEVNYLLQRMEDYRGIAILATNRKSLLDQAFLRRLRFLVDFPFPDATHRAGIWEKIFPNQAAVEGLDFAALSRLEIAGGNIKNIALNAAFLAASDGGAIRIEHVLQAARREYAKIDKLMLEAEFGPYYPMVKR